jgi:thiol-disulfide isomerase/thioredoxin
MNKGILLLVFATISVLNSCSRKPDHGLPTTDFKAIEKNFNNWWAYHNNTISLSSEFIGIDNSSNKISKEDFLKNLTSGDFIPLKLSSNDNQNYYQLFKLDQTADKEISSTIKNVSLTSFKYFRMEGKRFPKFNFTDLNGIEYNNDNTKGKIIIIKCWFIHCVTCVAEFPKLNELVEEYNNRKDYLFIGLATDPKQDLIQFLLKKSFNYAVVADQNQFMVNELGITSYPTHIIVGRDGLIQKVTNKADEMIKTLKLIELPGAHVIH